MTGLVSVPGSIDGYNTIFHSLAKEFDWFNSPVNRDNMACAKIVSLTFKNMALPKVTSKLSRVVSLILS